jgi:hypothetical protein
MPRTRSNLTICPANSGKLMPPGISPIRTRRALPKDCTGAVVSQGRRRVVYFRTPAGGQNAPRAFLRRPESKSPDRRRSIERRRRLAASGAMPPTLAAQYTVGELAVLRIVGDETHAKGTCDRSLAEIAARAGVCRKLAQLTLRLAARDGLTRAAAECPERPKHLDIRHEKARQNERAGNFFEGKL